MTARPLPAEAQVFDIAAPAAARDATLDLLRVTAAAAVVLLHVSAAVVVTGPDGHVIDWWTANFMDAAVRWSAPLFIMVSGALLLAKPIVSPVEFYKRRAGRILVPIVAWTVVYVALEANVTGTFDIAMAAKAVISGNPWYHMWYLYALVGLYVATPFLRLVVEGRLGAIYVGLGFTIAAIETLYSVARPPAGEGTFLITFLAWTPYFVAGHELRRRSRRRHGLLGIALICAIVITLATGILVPVLGDRSWDLTYSSFEPLVIVMTLAIFVYGLSARVTYAPAVAFIQRLAPLTLGIFLVHPMWLVVLNRVGLYTGTDSGFGLLLTTVLAFGLSAVTTAVLAAIPFLRATVR